MDLGNHNPQKKTQCPFCATTFSHRSSLIRHLRKKCNQPQPQSIRRKACSQCVTDKTRCNLDRPTCSRCSLRQIPCHYPYPTPEPSNSPSPESDEQEVAPQAPPLGVSEAPRTTAVLTEPPAAPSPNLFETLFPDPSNWDLTVPIDLNPFFSPRRDSTAVVLSEAAQIYSTDSIGGPSTALVSPKPPVDAPSPAMLHHSMEFIFRVLRTWPKMLADEFQTPPLIHHSHLKHSGSLPRPLANCFTLVRMWHGQCQGAGDMVNRLIEAEVDNLLNKFEELDEASLLAVLQAVVIYLIILLFPQGGSRPIPPDTNVFRKVQDLVNFTVRSGLFLPEEREQMRPTWAAWIHVTSKRRAVLALHLLQWAYAIFHNTPSLNTREVGFMPAPAAKILWQAQTEQEWNSLYIKWLARWDGRGYLQGEFEHIPTGIKMDPRTEKWLEETDEFGMIMMSIVNAAEHLYPSFFPMVH
ncbi:hypothetical protein BJY04DRAFT_187669 [Aspergillus karnatakaensis]|uniref:uncharacterized protein n=1 Tax=Aspergillus karnatakaensis TaxID=1810916 RepID=UPI003CCC97DE